MNPFLAIDRAMIGDIHTSRHTMDNLEMLCDRFGSRFAGTPAERQAADFIAETFSVSGLANVRLEEYSYTGWIRGAVTLELVHPISKRLPAISLPYCPPGSIAAEIVSADHGSAEEFAKLGGGAAGRVVMAASTWPPGYSRWIHRKEKYDRAVRAGAAAFIFVSEHPGAGPETGSLQNDREAPIPGISVAREDGDLLHRHLERHGSVQVSLITRDSSEPRSSWNVVGDLPGTSDSETQVILGCHYDGHDISQGAVDPASGMVVVMESARVLSQYAAHALGASVRFIAYGTEELGLIGSHRYVAAHEQDLDRIRFVLNLDSAGNASRKGVVLHRWDSLEPVFKQWVKDMSAEAPVGQKMSAYSDHFPFFLKGVPTGGLGDPESAPHGRGFGHTAYDTVDKVKLANLRDASGMAARLALRVSAAKEFPAKRRSDDEVRAILETDPELEGYRIERGHA